MDSQAPPVRGLPNKPSNPLPLMTKPQLRFYNRGP